MTLGFLMNECCFSTPVKDQTQLEQESGQKVTCKKSRRLRATANFRSSKNDVVKDPFNDKKLVLQSSCYYSDSALNEEELSAETQRTPRQLVSRCRSTEEPNSCSSIEGSVLLDYPSPAYILNEDALAAKTPKASGGSFYLRTPPPYKESPDIPNQFDIFATPPFSGPSASQEQSWSPQAPLRMRKPRQSLHAGLLRNDTFLISKTLEEGEDPNMEMTMGLPKTPLPILYAAEHLQVASVTLLLQHGAQINSVNASNQTAAHLVCMPHDDPWVKPSSLRGQPRSMTPPIETLHDLERLKLEMLQVLVANGIDLTIRDTSGYLASDYAQETKQTALYVFLTSASQSKSIPPVLSDIPLTPTQRLQLPLFPKQSSLPHEEKVLTPCCHIAQRRRRRPPSLTCHRKLRISPPPSTLENHGAGQRCL